MPHELSESSTPDVSRRERLLELGAVVIMSLATLLTAWSGYQAALWSGDQSQKYARASTTRIRAQAQSTLAGQLRIDDLANFNGWLEADNRDDTRLAALYERRFRPEFRPAFVAWRAQTARPSPLYMPQYRPIERARATALDAKADDLFTAGTDAKSHDDRYILSTVFFAAVLFFSGISLRLLWLPLRVVVMSLAGLLLTGGLVFVATLPVA